MDKLRDYQQEAVKRIFASLWEHRRVLLQLPCRSGKTIVFCAIAERVIERGHKILVLAHRKELINQGARHLARWTSLPIGIIKAGVRPNPEAPIQVASVQTLAKRYKNTSRDKYGLIIVDEAHHSPSVTYSKILEHYTCKAVGVTATPTRLDGKGFDDLYGDLIVVAQPGLLIQKRFISDYRLYCSGNPIKTTGAGKRGGEWNLAEVEALNDTEQLNGDIVDSYVKHRPHVGATNLVFALGVEHSKEIVEEFREAGIQAWHLDGTTPMAEREEVMELFANGEIPVISNYELFGEGIDLPGLEMVQIARPTQSLALWIQMVFRPLTKSDDKPYGIILDHTECSRPDKHGLPDRNRKWSLEGRVIDFEDDDEEKKPEQKPRDDSMPLGEPDINQDRSKELRLVSSTDYWVNWFASLVRTQQIERYAKGWIYYKVKDAEPPLMIWEAAAKYLDYRPGWAYHNHKKQVEQYQPEVDQQELDIDEDGKMEVTIVPR